MAWMQCCCGCGRGRQLQLKFDPSLELPYASGSAIKEKKKLIQKKEEVAIKVHTLKGSLGHFKRFALYPKDNKGRDSTWEVEMEYFKVFMEFQLWLSGKELD